MIGGELCDDEAIWGFVPEWDVYGNRPAAYAEGIDITRKRRFSRAFRSWRCIVPATSFTYLREVDGATIRYRLEASDDGLLLLGGIHNPNGPSLGWRGSTVALVTTAPNAKMMPHTWHVPLLIKAQDVNRWVCSSTDIVTARGLIRPCGADALRLTITVDARSCPSHTFEWPNAALQLA
jgi:putative SOS response-associated peptidase YedK